MSETTVPMDDKALFDAATSTEATTAEAQSAATTQEATTEQPAEQQGQPRDGHGRFAAKAEQAAPEAQPEPQQQPAPQAQQPADQVPPWRLREEAEARRAAEARAQQYERQLAQMNDRLRQLTEKPAPRPDMFENPDGFVQHGVREAINPIAQQMNGMREFFSQTMAVQQFGEEAVNKAYQAMGDAMNRGDPGARAAYERLMRNSYHPFGDLVKWHKRESTLSAVGDDPNAWFEKEFERRAKEDPAFAAKLKNSQPQAQNGAQQSNNVVKLPPSLTKTPGAAAAQPLSMDDASLFANALRP